MSRVSEPKKVWRTSLLSTGCGAAAPGGWSSGNGTAIRTTAAASVGFIVSVMVVVWANVDIARTIARNVSFFIIGTLSRFPVLCLNTRTAGD
jgi:hypothetical protein